MSDPVLALILLAIFFAAAAAARAFKTLDLEFGRAARATIPVGLSSGVAIVLADRLTTLHAPVIAVVMMFAAIWVRHTGEETEAADGMLLGAMSGAAAAIPAMLSGNDEIFYFSELIIAGAIAGYGITFASFHAAERLRQLAIDGGTAVAAILGAALPHLLDRSGIAARHTAVGVTAIIPLLAIVTMFWQWKDVRAELAHEAALGFMAEEDVRTTAHPFLRLGGGGWSDRAAHRRFVSIANTIALRKRQQRSRVESVARLHQLEIIKLRMKLQEMTAIDRTMRAQAADRTGDEGPSDRMHA